MNGVPHSSVSNAWKRKGPLMLPGSNVWNFSPEFFQVGTWLGRRIFRFLMPVRFMPVFLQGFALVTAGGGVSMRAYFLKAEDYESIIL
jgi:hypothetical protein